MKRLIETSGLTAREESIVRLHYGIHCPVHSIEEIAVIFDLPESVIRRIEAQALRKLRQRWFSSRNSESQAASVVEHLLEGDGEEAGTALCELPVWWEVTDEDREFLRSCNICPD